MNETPPFRGISSGRPAISRHSDPPECASGPAFRAPALSIPAGLTRDGLPVGFEIDGLPGDDNQLLRLGMAIEALLEPLPPLLRQIDP
jgi:Asp-tRNA(Asn)/Glu-tRNA(Gln) amidotransferase A subunit family amidase